MLPEQLKVEPDDGFKNDLLKRHDYGLNLLKTIEKIDQGAVIALDGQWGDGKTTFVKMWLGLLKEHNVHSLYIDAFAEDYAEDPFILLSSVVVDYMQAYSDKEYKQNFINKGKQIGSALVPLGIKLGTAGLLNNTDLEKFADDITKGINDVVAKKMQSYADDKKILEEFKNTLSTLPTQLNARNDKDQKNTKPLIIIIDELDRCKPTFAVQFLERIKHLFLVPNIVFVLVMNKQQLEESIKCFYGQIDANTYLQKFIDLETQLPKQSVYGHIKSSHTYQYLKKFELEEDLLSDYTEFLSHFNLSLRQLDRIFTYHKLLLNSQYSNHDRIFVLFFSTIKVIKPSLFSKFLLQQKPSYQDIVADLGLTNQKIDTRIIQWLYAAHITDDELQALCDSDESDSSFATYIEELKTSLNSVDNIHAYFARLTQKLGIFIDNH